MPFALNKYHFVRVGKLSLRVRCVGVLDAVLVGAVPNALVGTSR
jgi:hypothetical protein